MKPIRIRPSFERRPIRPEQHKLRIRLLRLKQRPLAQ